MKPIWLDDGTCVECGHSHWSHNSKGCRVPENRFEEACRCDFTPGSGMRKRHAVKKPIKFKAGSRMGIGRRDHALTPDLVGRSPDLRFALPADLKKKLVEQAREQLTTQSELTRRYVEEGIQRDIKRKEATHG